MLFLTMTESLVLGRFHKNFKRILLSVVKVKQRAILKWTCYETRASKEEWEVLIYGELFNRESMPHLIPGRYGLIHCRLFFSIPIIPLNRLISFSSFNFNMKLMITNQSLEIGRYNVSSLIWKSFHYNIDVMWQPKTERELSRRVITGGGKRCGCRN